GDVAGEQVRGELDPLEGKAEALREQSRDQGLRKPGVVLDEDVAVGEHSGEDAPQDVVLADDHLADGPNDLLRTRGQRRERHRVLPCLASGRQTRSVPNIPREPARMSNARRYDTASSSVYARRSRYSCFAINEARSVRTLVHFARVRSTSCRSAGDRAARGAARRRWGRQTGSPDA